MGHPQVPLCRQKLRPWGWRERGQWSRWHCHERLSLADCCKKAGFILAEESSECLQKQWSDFHFQNIRATPGGECPGRSQEWRWRSQVGGTVTSWDLGSSCWVRKDFKVNESESKAKWDLLKIHSKPGADQLRETMASNSWVIWFKWGIFLGGDSFAFKMDWQKRVDNYFVCTCPFL